MTFASDLRAASAAPNAFPTALAARTKPDVIGSPRIAEPFRTAMPAAASRALNAAMRTLRLDSPSNEAEMNTFQKLPERAMELATRVGGGIRDRVPDRAMQWVETGAALGAVKTGTRVATRVVRRNPVIFAAAVAGAGLLWYAARRRARKGATLSLDSTSDDAPLEGRSTRVEAKRQSSSASATHSRSRRSDGDEASAASTH